MSEGVKDVFVRLAGSQHGDDGAYRQQHSAQHEVRVGSAVALSESRIFVGVEVDRVQLAQSLPQERRLKNRSHRAVFGELASYRELTLNLASLKATDVVFKLQTSLPSAGQSGRPFSNVYIPALSSNHKNALRLVCDVIGQVTCQLSKKTKSGIKD